MKIIIPGEPIPKARPRFFSRNGKKLVYNSQSIQMSDIAWRIKGHALKCEFKASNEPCEIHLSFFFRPQPGKDMNLKLWGLVPNIVKKDLDNLEKLYLDSANTILYLDDSQIIKLSSSKHYSSNPRTEIIFMQRKPPVIDETVKAVLKLFTPEDMKDFYEELSSLGCSVQKIMEMDREAPELTLIEGTSYDLASFSSKWGDRLAKLGKLSFKECAKRPCF